MDGLKPNNCPCCGGKARQSYVGVRHMLFCMQCFIKTEAYDTPEEVLAVWNNCPPARELMLEELRGMERELVWLVVPANSVSFWKIAGGSRKDRNAAKVAIGGILYAEKDYGTTRTAFDRKPE